MEGRHDGLRRWPRWPGGGQCPSPRAGSVNRRNKGGPGWRGSEARRSTRSWARARERARRPPRAPLSSRVRVRDNRAPCSPSIARRGRPSVRGAPGAPSGSRLALEMVPQVGSRPRSGRTGTTAGTGVRGGRERAGPQIPVRPSPPLWAAPSSSGLAGTHVSDPPGRPQSAALESARDGPTPADAEVTAPQGKARSASRPFKALGPPEAFCPSPLPVVPLREAGFVRSPRPAAALPLAHAHCRRPPAPPRPARPGSRPGGGDATPRAPAPPPRPAARAHLPLALRCCSEDRPQTPAGAGLARDPSALLSCRNAPTPTCCPPSAQPARPRVSPRSGLPRSVHQALQTPWQVLRRTLPLRLARPPEGSPPL
ncbi:WD repeat-containing protein 5 isoform X1 [Mustela putorius furo]|uniref:WD repeat-containing protein 5 isoform X1 n=1 Tax=Mustela putorius furo TaxID=9669 RepID=A0A8U0S9B5_MUSPF|nr:WD repeat-containing protein 5 isoform X1 [Mustela putorius furo]